MCCMLRALMATKKKKSSPAKKQARKTTKSKPVVRAKKPTRKPAKKPARPARKSSGPRTPPMHARQVALEVDAPASEHSETFEIFKSFDRDGSGSIDRAELARLLEALGQQLSEEELEIALSVIDANGSGRVSWSEFEAWWSSR